MQISYVGQYNKNAAQTVGTPVPSSAVSSLSASVKELLPGSIFEGNVAYVRGGTVILSLENGQNIHARLDKNANRLIPGQSMFFQVRSNEGGIVAIRPYMGQNTAANPTLMRALEAAGLPADERNLEMVDAMMREQMPIHADAVLEMHRAIVGNEGIRVDTLVQMTKLKLPVTPQLAAQFENYRNDTHMLLGQMKDFMNELPQLLNRQSVDVPQLVQMNTQILDILTEQLPAEPLILPDADNAAVQQALQDAPQLQQPVLQENVPENAAVTDAGVSTDADAVFFSQTADDGAPQSVELYEPNQLGVVFDTDGLEEFSDVLRSIGSLVDNEAVFNEEGSLNPKLTVRQLLDVIDQELQAQIKSAAPENDEIRELLSHKGYQKLLTRVMEEQWLVEPQELKKKDKLSQLYDRLDRQMEQIGRVLKATGNEHAPLARTSEQIRGNMEFMNQVNQIYNYVQLPLKMHGQNANGDLYVYTNKRRPREENGELSAFLHLDMENLGSTDVMVKMKGSVVDTNFTFSDDESFALVEKYLPILDARLTALGYQTKITIGHEEKQMDFVEDFLKKDQPGGSVGVVHRYSFDVRA